MGLALNLGNGHPDDVPPPVRMLQHAGTRRNTFASGHPVLAMIRPASRSCTVQGSDFLEFSYLGVHQGMSPIGPQAAKRNPKHPVKGRQNRALLSSLKCHHLHSERCVLDGNDLMAAEEQSEESKHQQ